MVVRQQDGGCDQIEASPDDLARTGLHARYRSAAEFLVGEEPIACIEKQHSKPFDRLEGHAGAQIIQDCRFAGKHGASEDSASQDLLHGSAEALQRIIHSGQLCGTGFLSPALAAKTSLRAEPRDKASPDVVRELRAGADNHIFHGASAPVRSTRRRCRQVPAKSIDWAPQLQTATDEP